MMAEEIVTAMQSFFTETTRLHDSTGAPDRLLLDHIGASEICKEEVEYIANGELPPVADHPPPFSFERLLAFLDQRVLVWLNSDVFLLREDPNVESYALRNGVEARGYTRCFCLGLSKEDAIAVYQNDDDTPRATAQTTAACHFLVDLFCLSENDSAFIRGELFANSTSDAVLSRFVSQRIDTISTLSQLVIADVSLTASGVQDLTTLSEASEGRLEIKLTAFSFFSDAEDAFISFLRGRHGPIEMDGLQADRQLRVLSQGLPGNTRLQKLEISLYVASEEDMAEFAQGLGENEGLQELSVSWSSRNIRSANSTALRTVCEAHPTLQTLVLFRVFRRIMSLEQQTRKARHIQQLLASNTVLTDVRLDDEDEHNIDADVFKEFLWPHLGRLRFRAKFNAVMHDPNRIKLFAPSLAMLLDTRNDVNLAHFFVTVTQGALVEHICALVADRAMM